MLKKIALAATGIAAVTLMTALPASAGSLSNGRYYDEYQGRVVSGRDYYPESRVRYSDRRRQSNHRRSDPYSRHDRILRNRGGMSAWKVKRKLRNRGFRKIKIVDSLLPSYKFRACRNGKRFAIRTNRFGRVAVVDRIGRCGGRRNWRHANRYRNDHRSHVDLRFNF